MYVCNFLEEIMKFLFSLFLVQCFFMLNVRCCSCRVQFHSGKTKLAHQGKAWNRHSQSAASEGSRQTRHFKVLTVFTKLAVRIVSGLQVWQTDEWSRAVCCPCESWTRTLRAQPSDSCLGRAGIKGRIAPSTGDLWSRARGRCRSFASFFGNLDTHQPVVNKIDWGTRLTTWPLLLGQWDRDAGCVNWTCNGQQHFFRKCCCLTEILSIFEMQPFNCIDAVTATVTVVVRGCVSTLCKFAFSNNPIS